MNRSTIRTVCSILIVCFSAVSFQAQAVLVGTGQATGGAPAIAARATLALKLETLGLASTTARERVAALSDAEAVQLAGQVESAPAGADGISVGIILVVFFLFWRFVLSDQAKAEAAAKEAPKKQ